MSKKNPPQQSPDLISQQQEDGAASVSDDQVPGRDELQAIAAGADPVAAPAGAPPAHTGPVTSWLPSWHPGQFNGPVEPRHRDMAAGLMGMICAGVENFAPIRYGDSPNGIKARGADELAPLCAKYEGKFPIWYQELREEIRAGVFLASFIGATVSEVKRVQAIEARIEEIVTQLRNQNPQLTYAEARRQACSTLGVPFDGEAPQASPTTTH